MWDAGRLTFVCFATDAQSERHQADLPSAGILEASGGISI